MNLEVVICHFKEDLQWTSSLKHPFVVYNKNPKNNHLYKFNLPNYGFDTITYLTYITNNYNNLPDYVCFAQDYPFDHCENFVELVNNFDFKSEWKHLGLCYERTTTGPDPKHCHLAQTLEFAKKHNIECSSPIKYIQSAQCIVSKKLILRRPVEFYEHLKTVFPTLHHITNVNFTMEYLWPTILGFAHEIRPEFYDGSTQYSIIPGSKKK